MECKEVQNQLPSYLTGNITEICQIRIKKHLADCEQCAKLFSEERALDSLLDQWEFELPEIDLTQIIMARVEPPKVRRVRTTRSLSLVADMIAAAAAVLLIFYSSFALVNEIPKSIGHWSQEYMNLSVNTMDTLYKYMEDVQILKEEIIDDKLFKTPR